MTKGASISPYPGLFVSNQVIGEACVILQIFYEISKADARQAILHLFEKGNLAPLNGQLVIDVLKETGGAALMDRLISQAYEDRNILTLTNDRKMSKLSSVEFLK